MAFGDARFIERLQDVIDSVYIERFYRVVIKCGSEDHVRHIYFSLDKFL